MASLEIQNLSYRYQIGGVNNISFQVPSGKIACLLGPSGSGKTTLLKLISGFLKPQAGQISIDGKIIADDNHHFTPPQERNIGLVFQQHALFPHMTVEKNILYGCDLPIKEKNQLLDQLLESFKISQHRNRHPHQISGGEQQRVAIARALASRPKLLLMDEPFSSLDQSLRDQVQAQCLKIIREQGLTTVVVTHDEKSAEEMGDLIVRI